MPTGQKLLDSLAETWDFFFSDVLPTLQAIFYPVQVSGPCSHGTLGHHVGPPGLTADCPARGWAHPSAPHRCYSCLHLGMSQNLPPTHEMEMRTAPSQGLGKAQSSAQ